jgi:hypothetical protein
MPLLRGASLLASDEAGKLFGVIVPSEVEGPRAGPGPAAPGMLELVARTIIAVRRENSAAENTGLQESDVIEALGALERSGMSSTLPSRRASCGC